MAASYDTTIHSCSNHLFCLWLYNFTLWFFISIIYNFRFFWFNGI